MRNLVLYLAEASPHVTRYLRVFIERSHHFQDFSNAEWEAREHLRINQKIDAMQTRALKHSGPPQLAFNRASRVPRERGCAE
jgi:hypothetical protein